MSVPARRIGSAPGSVHRVRSRSGFLREQVCCRILASRVSAFLASARRRDESLEDFVSGLLGLGGLAGLAVIGGLPRELFFASATCFRSDLDFVAHPRDLSAFDAFVSRLGAVPNAFGGCNLVVGGWRVDVWPLQRTWAAAAGHRSVECFGDLLDVTFFDWDAAVFVLDTGRLIVPPGHFGRLASRVLGIGLAANPKPTGNSIRALRRARQHGARFTRPLAQHVLESLEALGPSALAQAECRSYGDDLLVGPEGFRAAHRNLLRSSMRTWPSTVDPFGSGRS